MAHVADYKKEKVKELLQLADQYPIVGIVNMENMPAAQLQRLREQLRSQVVLNMSKKTIMQIVFDKAKEKKAGIEKLTTFFRGMPAIMFTKENPFKLASMIKKNKSKAPAKAGQTAPNNIVVKAGATPFAPGPVIGELGALGIKAGVENGKVAIKEDKVVVKEGEVISQKAAELLSRLGIEPMEVGLDLLAVYEDGEILEKNVLFIDEEEYKQKFEQASSWAFNLAVNTAYPTDVTLPVLIVKAHTDAKALALDQNLIADEIIGELVGKAEQQMLALKSNVKIEEPQKAEEKAPEAPKEEPKQSTEEPQEKKEETKPEEAPKEEPKQEEKAEAPKKEETEKQEEKTEETKPEQKAPEAPKEEKSTEEPKQEEKTEEKPAEEQKEEPQEKAEEKPATPEEKPQEEQKPEEPPKQEEKPVEEKSTEEKVAKIVDDIKRGGEPKGPTAEELVEEATAMTEEQPKEEPKEKTPTAHELADKKKTDDTT